MLFLYTPEETVQGVQGVLTFDTQQLTLLSMEAVPDGWIAETGAEGTFIVYDDSLEAPLTGTQTLARLTFAVQEALPANTEITVQLTTENEHADTAEAQLVMIVRTVLPGDVNADGSVDDKDRMLLSRFLADWNISAYMFDPAAADINHDGRITAIDRMILARYLAEWGDPYTQYFS